MMMIEQQCSSNDSKSNTQEIQWLKIVHAQTVLTEDELAALKKKCNESSTKEALSMAVQHYLECEYTDLDDKMWTKKLEKVVQKKKQKKV